MANLQVNQIRKHLTDNYIRFVDASDIKATDEDKDIHILSRAYAAYAVVTLGNYEPQDVCACITDEYEDNGIDLVYIDNNLSLYEYLLGLSHDKFDKLIAMYGGGSGYKMYLIEFGMLSIVFVFFFYFYMLYLFKENRYFMIGAFLLFVIAFIQRSYPFWISEMFIFMLGPSYILVNNQSKIDGKS